MVKVRLKSPAQLQYSGMFASFTPLHLEHSFDGIKFHLHKWKSTDVHIHYTGTFNTQTFDLKPSESIRNMVNNAVYVPYQVLQCVTHELLLERLHQGHFYGLCVVLGLTVRAEPLRKNWTILHRYKGKKSEVRITWQRSEDGKTPSSISLMTFKEPLESIKRM